jgi:hypothetical protein
MSAIEAIVDKMRSRAGEMTTFEGLLSEISVCLTDILAVMEKPEPPDTHDQEEVAALKSIADALNKPDADDKEELSILRAIAEAIKALQLKAPDIQVNVPPAQVVVMPADERPMRGWKLRITGRDGNNNISEISFKPDGA